jgi:hypothetical protein
MAPSAALGWIQGSTVPGMPTRWMPTLGRGVGAAPPNGVRFPRRLSCGYWLAQMLRPRPPAYLTLHRPRPCILSDRDRMFWAQKVA